MMNEEDLQFEAELRRIGEGYCMFVLCCVGVIGNSLSFITFSTKAVRHTSTSIYLRALAIADLCVLLTAVFRYKTYKIFLDEEHDLDSVFHLDGYVEVYVEPVHWMSLGASSFITIILSLERYIAVKSPLRVRRCSSPLVILGIVSVVLLSVALTVPNYASYKIVHFDFFGYDVAVAKLTDYGRQSMYPCAYHNYLVPILWYIIPAVLLSVMNILLSLHVRKSTRIRVGTPHLTNPNRNLTLMIILIVSVYIVCNLPKCIFMFYKLVTTVSDHQECVDVTSHVVTPDTRAYLVIEVITELLNVLNSCMNVIIYCLVGSRFRRALVRVLKCQWRHTYNSWQANTSTRQVSTHRSIRST